MVEQEKMFDIAMRHVACNSIEGDYLEFGVYRGKTFLHAYRAALASTLDRMRFVAFDSFLGLPEVVDGEKDDRGAEFKAGRFACSAGEFMHELRKANVDLARVHLVEGWYSETLTKEKRDAYGVSLAAVVWVDCDLYESAKRVLEFVTPFLQIGTIICFDDWFCSNRDPNQGEQRACREWLCANPNIGLSPFHEWETMGKSFVVAQMERTLR